MKLKKVAIAALSAVVLSTSFFSINVSAAKELVRTNAVNRFDLGTDAIGGTGPEDGKNWIKIQQNSNNKKLFEDVGGGVDAAALQVTFEISNWSGKEFGITWGGNITFKDGQTVWCGTAAFEGISNYKIDRNGEYTITCDLAKMCESIGKQGISNLQTCEMVITGVDYGDKTMIEVKRATIYLPGEEVPEDKLPSDTPSSDLADYTKLDEAIAKIPTDLSKYTAESVKALNNVLNSIDKNLTIAEQDKVDEYVIAVNEAIVNLELKPQPLTVEPPVATKTTTKTPAKTTAVSKTTRSAAVVAKDKVAAEKVMKQAKIKKLTVKSKAKKKITVTWKKVKKAVGYQVQVSTKKNFKKTIYDKLTAKKKLTIKSKIKSGKTYYVRVRAYAAYKDANNTPVKVYSAWNKQLRKVKIK